MMHSLLGHLGRVENWSEFQLRAWCDMSIVQVALAYIQYHKYKPPPVV